MSVEAGSQGEYGAALSAAEAAVREAVACHGTTHPEVLDKLEKFVALLYKAGDTAKAEKLNERAQVLKKILASGVQATRSAQPAESAPVASFMQQTAQVPGEGATGESEIALFNSKGEHVATACDAALYTPEGRNVGRWNEDLCVYLDRSGWYLGQIVEENRLAKDSTWQYRHMNFGEKGNEGDRAGWGRCPDIGPAILPYGFDDVKIG